MKALAIAALLLFGVSSRSARAEGGHITVFADPAGVACTLLDQTPGTFNVYIFHTGIDAWAMSGSRFKMISGAGFSAIYVGETIAGPNYVGSVMTDISFAYGCTTSSVFLATVTFNGLGTSAPCSYLDIVGVPPFGQEPIAQDCYFSLFPAPSVSKLYVNPTAQCQCAVATEPTTWGSVKALYR